MITEHNVEYFTPKWQMFSAALHEWEAPVDRAGEGTGMGKLPFTQIEANRSSPHSTQSDGPLRGAAAKFKNCTSVHTTKNAELGFRNAPDTPGHRVLRKRC